MKQGISRAARKDKVLQMLGSHGQPTRSPAAGYAQARQMVSPQTYRPKPEEPSAQLVRWVQAALCVLLGLRLPLTGMLDAATRAGLLRLQREAGLPQSGAIDAHTLRWLEQQTGLTAPHVEGAVAPRWAEWACSPVASAAPPPPRPPHGGTMDGESVAAAAAHAPAGESLLSASGEEALATGEPRAEDAHGLWLHGNDQAPSPAAVARLLQREALHGVMTQAFAREWLMEEAERSGRPGTSGLLAELLAWWTETQNSRQPPPWWNQVLQWANEQPHKAVDTVRRAWRERSS